MNLLPLIDIIWTAFPTLLTLNNQERQERCMTLILLHQSLLRTVKEAYAWITSITVLQHANTKAVSIGKGQTVMTS